MDRSVARSTSLGAAVVMLLAAATLVCPGAQAQSQPAAPKADASAPAGNVDNGKKFFKSYGCYQCHGNAAQGAAGARLAPRPIPFKGFLAYVRQPKGQMPPYTAKVLSEKDLADIYAFLQTVPTPPDPKNIPLLND
jgi:mono/diheme cytochrome c family protein